jgi:DNA-binding transcriptional ArsR family regulator
MPEPHRRLTDARELRALAHPVRMAIIEQLSISGPLTATELAGRLGETPANCSWHLRKLAQFGFVEEAEGGTGRQRPWQVPGLGFSFGDSDGAGSADAHRAAAALAEVTMARAVDRLREATRRAADEPAEWRKAMDSRETVAWLTAEELAELNEALREVLERYDRRLEDKGARPKGARLCEFVTWGVPARFPGVEEA